VDDAIGLKFPENSFDKAVVAKIAGPEMELLAISLPERGETLPDGTDRRGAPRTHFFHPVTTEQYVCTRNVVSTGGKMLC